MKALLICSVHALFDIAVLEQRACNAAFARHMMDAAPELMSGRLMALPVTGTNIAAQSISVAVDSRRTLPRIAYIVADCLGNVASETLSALRQAKKT